jgi:hypothetical protein
MRRMNSLSFSAGRIIAITRFTLLVSCALALAACETDGTGPTATDAPRAEPAAAKPDAAAVRTQAAKPPEPVRDAEPMTRSRAARECWMRTEKGNAREDLDRRADLVNKCIDEKMKAASTAPPKT